MENKQVDNEVLFAIFGWVSTALIIIVPIIFGPAGVVLGYFLSKTQKTHGLVMMILAAVFIVLAMLFWFIVFVSCANDPYCYI